MKLKWLNFIIVQLLILGVVGAFIKLHEDKVTLIKTPPSSLAKWYKPENKRQVWLHNMFKLRRELQAVELYAKNQNTELMKKWLSELSDHYLKIAEMVPEWQKKVDKELLTNIKTHAQNENFDLVLGDISKLQSNCDSCHTDYRAITAMLYRSPNFENIMLSNNIDFDKHMKTLGRQVNQIKIATTDKQLDTALSALTKLSENMDLLGNSCKNCHKNNEKIYPDPTIKQSLVELQFQLTDGTTIEQGKALGTLAVLACASCHGTHRISSDTKNLINHETSWQELIKH
jgi:cytochrome c556